MSEYRQHPGPAPSGRPAQQRVPRGAAPDVRAGAQPGAYRPATAQHAAYRSAQPAQRRSAGGGGYPYRQQPTYQQPIQQQPWGGQPQAYREPPRYKDDRHRDDDYHYRKKKKRMDIFDIFD